jgi:SARP family transcriptional regulator, regulator of embCAB operon
MIGDQIRPMLTAMVADPATHVSSPLKVLVATDRSATRAALTALLDSEPGMRPAGIAADLPTAIGMIRSTSPDAVLVDRTVLGPVGLGRLAMLAAAAPHVAVFHVGMGDHPRLDAAAREAGAAGYIRLDEAPERLSAALTSPSAA